MNQKERRKYLIKELLAEVPGYSDIVIPDEEDAQKRLLRSLMNVRPPRPVSDTFLEVQDAYLGEEAARRGVTDGMALPETMPGSRIVLWQGDITMLKADAIVNAANSALRGCFAPCHSCIDNMIHSRSGVQLRLICDKMMNEQGHDEPTGRAKITPAYNLPARHVIHTVGPVVAGPLTQEHCRQLASCYRSCLSLAAREGLRSIAFCCISTGEFHFPNDIAAQIAVETTEQFFAQNENCGIERVIFNVFKDIDLELYKKYVCMENLYS